MKVIVALLLSVFVVLAVSQEVTVLTQENYDSSVASGVWLIKYYAPWCGHCKKLAPTWDELATKVGTNFHVGKVDCTVHKEICTKNDVRGYPTILLIKDGGNPEKYNGQRTINDFVSFVEKNAGTGKAAEQPKAEVPKDEAPKAEAPKVEVPKVETVSSKEAIVLTDSTFAQARTGVWLVDFYAPWCGHCKTLAPIWDQLAATADGRYNVAKVDVTTEKNLAGEFNIRSLPTIKLFVDGKETQYSGERTVAAFDKFVLETVGERSEKTVERAAPAAPTAETDGGVYVLNADNFESITQGKTFFVKFYAPWCGHCKNMAPAWSELATTHPEYNIAKVDCTVNQSVCSKFDVRGYPTLILLKSDGTQVKYQNARAIPAFVEFLNNNA